MVKRGCNKSNSCRSCKRQNVNGVKSRRAALQTSNVPGRQCQIFQGAAEARLSIHQSKRKWQRTHTVRVCVRAVVGALGQWHWCVDNDSTNSALQLKITRLSERPR
jgi:hypothetical protein